MDARQGGITFSNEQSGSRAYLSKGSLTVFQGDSRDNDNSNVIGQAFARAKKDSDEVFFASSQNDPKGQIIVQIKSDNPVSAQRAQELHSTLKEVAVQNFQNMLAQNTNPYLSLGVKDDHGEMRWLNLSSRSNLEAGKPMTFFGSENVRAHINEKGTMSVFQGEEKEPVGVLYLRGKKEEPEVYFKPSQSQQQEMVAFFSASKNNSASEENCRKLNADFHKMAVDNYQRFVNQKEESSKPELPEQKPAKRNKSKNSAMSSPSSPTPW